ncbi:RidA family protein [Roseicyclus mahoneyensis]|uniref:2-iminobutanoate/2-iminopropanoate deaminase n=1 Tax=Roseicyclus mahoneyensis TaxID=164332 RepID=A0A316H3L3_9RHOB|nr:RidA family protein [Roseicyclus mahoneyensis]PWK62103.1 2-iminobutanoate/2-iminopropanoate deaminase [Roseicyclus mahoneyensis]
MRVLSTDAAPPPFSAYAQGVEIGAGARQITVAGQVGMTPEGVLVVDARGQHRQAWANVAAILAAGGMTVSDITEIIGIVTGSEGVALFREERERALGPHLAAATLIVAGLAHPDWQVEIMVRAARAVDG